MLSWVEYEKSFITSVPDLAWSKLFYAFLLFLKVAFKNKNKKQISKTTND